MKQRFLNQKLGKRMSRKSELVKTKASAVRSGSKLAGTRKPSTFR
jgi:hypothetical protein